MNSLIHQSFPRQHTTNRIFFIQLKNVCVRLFFPCHPFPFSEWNHCLGFAQLQHFDYLPFFCIRCLFIVACRCFLHHFLPMVVATQMLNFSIYFCTWKHQCSTFLSEKKRAQFFFSIWNMCKVLRAPKLIAASAFHFCITHMFQWPNMMLIADARNNLE